jgi:dsDNA-specific endonuclease/ATPase MutS2
LNTVERMTPQELQKVLDELEASRSSRKRAWENLQEIRWVLQDSAGMKLPPAAKKTIDLEGKLIKDGVRKAIRDRQNALHELLNAINQYRKLIKSEPLKLRGSEYANAVLELNKAIDQAEGLLLQ